MLDYTTRDKKVLPVKISEDLTLLLRPPKKNLYEKLAAIEDRVNDATDGGTVYDEIVELTADILSTNMSRHQFSAAEVEEMFDIEDMAALVYEYAAYAGNILKNPN